MNSETIKQELFERIMDSKLPDDLTIDKIVYRAYDFNKEKSRISFFIVLHPGLGGRTSGGRGIGLSAFLIEETKYTYHLEQEKWTVNVISSTLKYDSRLMAEEEVVSLDDGGFFSSEEYTKEELEVIIEKAQEAIRGYYLETCEDNISEEFFIMLESLSVELRKVIEKKYSV